jgi:ATP-dependent Clp protease ATP-binding subunit ClpB
MNINKFTQNSLQAVQDCEKLAYEYGHQEIDVEHLLYCLLTLEDSLIKKLFEKMDKNTEVFLAQVKGLLIKRPKVSGGQVFISNDLNKILISAEDEAKQMGDSYVSVEHLFLSMLKQPGRNGMAFLTG